MFTLALKNISVLVICMAMGFAAKKGKIIDEKGIPMLSAILVNISLPCLMLMSMQREFEFSLLKSSMMVIFITLILHMGEWVVAFIATKLLKADVDESVIWTFSLIFANMSYMGIPVIESMYGADILFYASMINMVFNIFVFTLGIKLMQKDSKVNIKAIFLNKPIVATMLGFLMFISSIKIPELFSKPLLMLGNMTTPLSMIIIGAILASNDLKTVFSGWKVYVVAFLRLLGIPLLLLVILRLFIEDEMLVTVLVMLSAMPVAAITAIFAAEYNRSPALGSKMVFITTVLSVFTIPVVAKILSL